jgi:hypothetical protein
MSKPSAAAGHEDDVRAREASAAAIAEVVAAAREILGDELVTYIGRANEVNQIAAWAAGAETPDTEIERRLRVACYAAVLIRQREGRATVRAWFIGMNPQLDDRPAAELLRDGTTADLTIVAAAARSFWTNG